jgi:hypothetical protein
MHSVKQKSFLAQLSNCHNNGKERVFNLAMFVWNEQNYQTIRLYFDQYDLQQIPLYDSIC